MNLDCSVCVEGGRKPFYDVRGGRGRTIKVDQGQGRTLIDQVESGKVKAVSSKNK